MSLTIRQSKILEILSKKQNSSNSEILSELIKKEIVISKNTLLRDLDKLITLNIVSKTGKTGRYLKYYLVKKHPLFSDIDIVYYLKKDSTKRNSKPTFDFDIFKNLHTLFTANELKKIREEISNYQKRLKTLPPDIIRKETERLTIELSWKSSQIEGNTYSILETETLLNNQIEAKGHDKREATMLLNHKASIEYIHNDQDKFKKISKKKILDIHEILVKNMDIHSGFRSNLIGITGTTYIPLIGKSMVTKAVEKMVTVINKTSEPFEKALIALAMISYIQAFSDGNKRTGRILANAILLANNYCPLSFRSVDPTKYKKALLLFYEQNNLTYFKKLFIEQYLFSVGNYYQ